MFLTLLFLFIRTRLAGSSSHRYWYLPGAFSSRQLAIGLAPRPFLRSFLRRQLHPSEIAGLLVTRRISLYLYPNRGALCMLRGRGENTCTRTYPSSDRSDRFPACSSTRFVNGSASEQGIGSVSAGTAMRFCQANRGSPVDYSAGVGIPATI